MGPRRSSRPPWDVTRPPEQLDAGLLPAAVRHWRGPKTPTDGGFGAAPKFPPSAVLEFLVRHARRALRDGRRGPGDGGATLAAMARSALFDQLDGGFARYSVTRDWSVPHFEKMLYDNAQLLRVYVHWVRLGGTPGSRRRKRRILPRAPQTGCWCPCGLGLPDGGADGAE